MWPKSVYSKANDFGSLQRSATNRSYLQTRVNNKRNYFDICDKRLTKRYQDTKLIKTELKVNNSEIR